VIEFPGGMGTCGLTAEPENPNLVLEATSPANLAEMPVPCQRTPVPSDDRSLIVTGRR
jgi:hypothetical protein